MFSKLDPGAETDFLLLSSLFPTYHRAGFRVAQRSRHRTRVSEMSPRTVSWPAGQSSPDSEEGSVPSRPQQAAPECTGVAALGVGSSRTCRHSLLSLISGGGTARRRGWHGAAERLHAGPIRVLASTCMSFLMWDKLLSWP